ncbi:MAG: hypothetical protein HZC10_10090, partial [Nitrospirae bacterium]|nr:hypothetical protein [Nitrospirota bacterium]
REGNKWLFSRLLAERNPVLKRHIDRTRIRVYFFSMLQKAEFFSELNAFLGELKGKKEGVPIYKRLEFKKSFAIPAAAILSIPAVLIFIFSNFTYSFFEKEESFFRLSLKHQGQRLIPCDDKAFIREQAERYKKLLEETNKVPMQLIKMGDCSRERHPVYIEARIDGELKLVKSYRPTGIKKDGPSFAFERISLPPGQHEIDIRMRDSGEKDSFEYTYKEKIKFESGKMIPLDFDSASKSFYIRK